MNRVERLGNYIPGMMQALIAMGLGLLLGVAFAFSPLLTRAIMIAGLVVATPLLVWTVLDLRVGTVVIFVTGFFVLYLKRLAWSIQVGLAIDGVLVLMLLGLFLHLARGRKLPVKGYPTSWLLLLNFLYCSVEILNPLAPSLANGIYAIRFLAGYSLIYFVSLFLMIPAERDAGQEESASASPHQILRLFAILWLVLSTIVALYGLYQHFFGFNTYERIWLQGSSTHFLGETVRIFSTLGSADILGTNMAISVVLSTAIFFGCKRWRLAAVAALPIQALALLFTQTRGSYAAAAAGLSALAIMTRDRRLVGALLVVVVLIGAFIVIEPDHYYAERLLSTANPGEDASFLVRWKNISANLSEVLSHPFGIGPGSSGRRGRQLLSWTDYASYGIAFQRAYTATDSYYFKLALEVGPVGLAIFLSILVAVGVEGRRAFRRAAGIHDRWLVAGLVCSIIVIAVNSLVNDCFEHTPNSLFFWFSTGLLAGLSRGGPAAENLS